MSLTVGELFAGIGGFGLGFERAGFQVKWQVEIDDYATRVLEKHWPNVERFRDVRTCGAHNLEPVDVVCGGFPCQPHSTAGRRKGAADERDLWPEFRRIIRELKPRWIVAENVAGLLSNDAGRFFGDILRDMAESGFDAEWDCIPASAVGAPHRRDRVWIVAHAQRDQQSRDEPRNGPLGRMGRLEQSLAWDRDWQDTLLELRGMDDGLSYGVERTDCLRNAVVPQIPEWIARRILDAEGVTA